MRISLNPTEQDVLRHLADKRDHGNPRVMFDSIPALASLSEGDRRQMIQRLEGYHLIEFQTTGSVAITDIGVEAVHDLDHPQPKDYWKEIQVWFRSQPWSIPVLLAIVGLPLIVKWTEMINDLLKWIGATN